MYMKITRLALDVMAEKATQGKWSFKVKAQMKSAI